MFITVPVLVLWYTAHAVLSRFVGTCNNGDTGRFVVGLIVGVPAGTVAAILLLRASASRGWRIGVVLATTPFAFVSLCLWVPLAISAGIHGHHLCGPEFDASLAAGDEWERVIPLAHAAVGSVLLVGALVNVRRTWRAVQPGVEPDGRLRDRGLTP